MAAAVKILAVAINKAGEKSEPFPLYNTGDVTIPKKFTLRVMSLGANKDTGIDQVKVSNFKLKLVGTHGSDYIDEKLTGFRLKVEDDVFVRCELYSEYIASDKDLKEAEEF